MSQESDKEYDLEVLLGLRPDYSGKIMFKCHHLDCKNSFVFFQSEDPTSSSGCCLACGGEKWSVWSFNPKTMQTITQLY